MKIEQRIETYIDAQPELKRQEMRELHQTILNVMPAAKLWFLDGTDDTGKIVSNPNIGYGFRTIKYANGKTKDFYQIGISTNTAGISVYILGIEDKNYLAQTYGKSLGKASITGYCIKFKTLKDINIDQLQLAIKDGINQEFNPT